MNPARRLAALAALAFFSRGTFAEPSATPLTAENPRCEYLVDPIGVDAPQPRLSWTLACDRRGARQTAYEVAVASTAARLESGQVDLWDSGRVTSAAQFGVVYAGKPLASRQACAWHVRAWDEAGRPGPWSRTATWEVGLRDKADWQAHWIDEGDVRPRGTLKIVSAKYGPRDVAEYLRNHIADGRLDFDVTNAFFGGDPAKDKVKQLLVHYTVDGGPDTTAILKEDSHAWLPPLPPQVLRRAFRVDKPVAKARLYATALGQYDLRLNGRPVTDAVFTPNWTDYRVRVRYQAYDVTSLVHPGDNALGGSIANGFYSGHIANSNFQFWGTRPALLAQLEVTYADGSVERVCTDEQWKAHPGPISATDIMLGEDYDARQALDGSATDIADTAGWSPVKVRTESLPPQASPQVSEPIRELLTLSPKAVTEPTPGHYVFDLGQNMVGVPRLRLVAPAGTRVVVRFAEMLKPDGTLYTANYRNASSVDTYVCRGGGPETWQPTFTYHGFRYVELTGLPAKPDASAVTGVVLGSDTPSVGAFECSDSRINQLWSNIRWGQRGNFFGVPTDCPQRDERLGWMGDAQVFVGTAVYNCDTAAFYTKWLVDVDDDQKPDGAFTSTCPDTNLVTPGVPGWADAGVICPWTVYRTYGDTRELAQHLPAMMKWVDWCVSHSTDLIRDRDRGSDFGDWLSINADTNKELLGTAYFAHSADLTANACRVLGDTANAAKYEDLFARIKAAFRERYVHPDGTIANGTQTSYALALAFDLLPEAERAGAAAKLAADVHAKGDHLSTGFLGVSYLLPVLTDHGQTDTAFGLLLQDSFPSWLFSIKHGATTIWERWDGWTPEKGFQRPGMNSFNHYSLGSCGQWLYERVGGIAQRPGDAGFSHVEVRPLVGHGLTHATTGYDSIRGTIRTAWQIEGGRLTLDVTVPPNVTATVYVPTSDPAKVTESGKPAGTAEGLKPAGPGAYEVGSGTYHFEGPADAAS